MFSGKHYGNYLSAIITSLIIFASFQVKAGNIVYTFSGNGVDQFGLEAQVNGSISFTDPVFSLGQTDLSTFFISDPGFIDTTFMVNAQGFTRQLGVEPFQDIRFIVDTISRDVIDVAIPIADDFDIDFGTLNESDFNLFLFDFNSAIEHPDPLLRNFTGTLSWASVPEPGTFFLLVIGLLGLGFQRYRLG